MDPLVIASAADRPAARSVAITLVWIDSREAVVVRGSDREVRFAHVPSDVVAHHHGTGHVRHDPCVRHGGAGPHAGGEASRQEHLHRFLEAVALRIPNDEDVLLIGPATVHEQLARLIHEQDAGHRNVREVVSERAPRMSRRQLAIRLRRAIGEDPRRHSVGAYRWTVAGTSPPPHERAALPRRVIEKRSHRPGDEPSDD